MSEQFEFLSCCRVVVIVVGLGVGWTSVPNLGIGYLKLKKVWILTEEGTDVEQSIHVIYLYIRLSATFEEEFRLQKLAD